MFDLNSTNNWLRHCTNSSVLILVGLAQNYKMDLQNILQTMKGIWLKTWPQLLVLLGYSVSTYYMIQFYKDMRKPYGKTDPSMSTKKNIQDIEKRQNRTTKIEYDILRNLTCKKTRCVRGDCSKRYHITRRNYHNFWRYWRPRRWHRSLWLSNLYRCEAKNNRISYTTTTPSWIIQKRKFVAMVCNCSF